MTYKKIDLFFDGKYLCSTNWSKTCKAAKQNYLDTTKNENVVKNPKLLKAFFDKSRR